MQYRLDKISGNKLSVLGFGCMRLPGLLGSIDMHKSEELVMAAIQGGVNYFDTAWIYPGSEEALGTILDNNKAREKVFIATKLPLLVVKSSDDFDKYFNQELKRLRTDYIDYYLMHSISGMTQWNRLKQMGIEEWIAIKKKAGLIRQAGFSFHGSQTDFLNVIDDYNWEMCLMQYNYSNENYQAGITGLRRAAEKMPVMIMEPLLGGKLANGLPPAAVDIFKKANPQLSPAAWALNWVWNHSEVTLLLSGMNDMKQLEENLRLADSCRPDMLDKNSLDVYSRVLEVFSKTYKIQCTGCNYCMPCPSGVNIPACFASYNASYSLGYVAGIQQFFTSTGLVTLVPSSPSQCINCGKCEKHCPQHLPIMKLLVLVRRRLEFFLIRFAGFCGRAIFGIKRPKKTKSRLTSHGIKQTNTKRNS